MKPIYLDERVVQIDHCQSGLRFSWPAGVSSATPFWLGEFLIGDDSDRFFDEPFPYRAIARERGHLSFIAVRTDAYPLMWMWAWFKWRLDQTMSVLPSLIIFVLNIWDWAYTPHGSMARWSDIGKRSPHPISYPRKL